MNNYKFKLPNYSRISWVSDQAQEVWEPRIKYIIKAWREIEWLSIIEKKRKCATVSMGPDTFLITVEKWLSDGLSFLPLGYQSANNYCDKAIDDSTLPTENSLMNIIVGSTQEHVLDFKAAYKQGIGFEKIFNLVGYPPCCRDAFLYALENGKLDLTWSLAKKTFEGNINDENILEITNMPVTNNLWQSIGIRLIPHIPCSYTCRRSMDLANQYLDIGKKYGYKNEMNWLLEILSWPVQWSCLHGIAEILTPIMKISTCTNATPKKYTIRLMSKTYPELGGNGITYPYNTNHISNFPSQFPTQYNKLNYHPQEINFQKTKQNKTNSIFNNKSKKMCETKKGINIGKASNERFISKEILKMPWYYKDNGFSSLSGMEEQHEPIIKTILHNTDKKHGNILDLGCGNGALLKKIHLKCGNMVPFGIDVDPSKIEHAKHLLSANEDNFVIGNIYNFDTLFPRGLKFSTILLSFLRITEMNKEDISSFGSIIHDRCNALLLYDYYNRDLEVLANKYNILFLDPFINRNVRYAKIVSIGASEK